MKSELLDFRENKRQYQQEDNKINVTKHIEELRKPWIVDQSSDFFVYVCWQEVKSNVPSDSKHYLPACQEVDKILKKRK